jgi:hypothetical protein
LGDPFSQLLDALVDLGNRKGNLLAVSTMFVGLALRHRSSSASSTHTFNEECFVEVHSGRASALGMVKKSLTQPR